MANNHLSNTGHYNIFPKGNFSLALTVEALHSRQPAIMQFMYNKRVLLPYYQHWLH